VVNLMRGTTPAGGPTIQFMQGSHTLYQVWLRR
jgi:hypothetical protein